MQKCKSVDKLQFIEFDPLQSDIKSVPNLPGNYIVVLREGTEFPNLGISIIYHKVNNLKVLYTGISNNLRRRDVRNHFYGTADKSTFRKSLGILFNYPLIVAREVKKEEKIKKITDFSPIYEEKLSKWMKENLILYYIVNKEKESLENELISELNPPLNIDKNHNIINLEFRKELKSKRRTISSFSAPSKIFVAHNSSLQSNSGKYLAIWDKYKSSIISILKGEIRTISIPPELFYSVGKRFASEYNFVMRINGTDIEKKKNSAVARDLRTVLLKDKHFNSIANNIHLKIRFNDFKVTIE